MNETEHAGKQSQRQAQRLSKDGMWRSFPRVPHLLQYTSSGKYYARIKVNGKLIRQSLGTDVFTTAKLKLTDFLKEKRSEHTRVPVPIFKEALAAYERKVDTNTGIKESSKEYRKLCLTKIKQSWEGIEDLSIFEITREACRNWAAKLKGTIHGQYFNNTIATLRLVLDEGIRIYQDRGGSKPENSAEGLARTRIPQKDLKLPEPRDFQKLIANIRAGSGRYAQPAGDLVEFLAYTGLRINSEARWVEWDDVNWQRKEIIVRGDPETRTKNSEFRRIPLILDLEKLLVRMKGSGEPSGPILKIFECRGALTRACSVLKMKRITHHDLRHLYATRCIESGVDIPTVARWLGHKDGGALAMKTYGHLRNEHSQAMAAKVKF